MSSQTIFNADSVVHGNFNEVLYTSGITEGGSSGAALLTLLESGGYYEVRGAVSEGNLVTCPAAPGVNFDDYSRVEDMLPLVRQYLTPFCPNPAAQVVAVEFHHKALDHYFLTANPGDINDLDTGVLAGWERTGLRFLAHIKQAAGTNPVCRFYRAPPYGDSHFYSASPAECAATAAQYPGLDLRECGRLLHPATGCQAAFARRARSRSWRFFNKVTINHRYTAEVVIRDQMRAKPAVWVPEGYGRDQTVMCASLR